MYAIDRPGSRTARVGTPVWKTRKAVTEHLEAVAEGYIAYRVFASWFEHTQEVKGAEWRTLTIETTMTPVEKAYQT